MTAKDQIKAIILAAGEGTRLRPYTLDRPKCLVEISGQSLLQRQLNVLSAESITSVILIGGYRAQMLEDFGLLLRVNKDYAETNMVWTLFCAENELEGELIVSYGDIVYSREILNKLLESKKDISVAIDLDWESYWRLRNENPLDDAETLKLSEDGRILEIGQKPSSLSEIDGQYMGLMKFSNRGVQLLKQTFHDAKLVGNLCGKTLESCYMTDLLQAMISANHRIDAVTIRGAWVEIDTVSDLTSETTSNRLTLIDGTI